MKHRKFGSVLFVEPILITEKLCLFSEGRQGFFQVIPDQLIEVFPFFASNFVQLVGWQRRFQATDRRMRQRKLPRDFGDTLPGQQCRDDRRPCVIVFLFAPLILPFAIAIDSFCGCFVLAWSI